MKRILIAAALAVLTLAASSSVARADQRLTFNIAGAGRIVGQGLDCSRTPGAPLTGDCSELVTDVLTCDERGCPVHDPGSLSFQALDGNGYHFASWTHPQCGAFLGPPPFTLNPCTVLVAIGGPNPDLAVTATFADVQPPTVALTAPANGAAVRGTIPLSATATDNSGSVSTVVLRVAGNPFQTFETPPFATSFDTRTRPDGPLTFSATATDAAALSSSAAATVTVDNTNPALTLTGPADGAVFKRGRSATWQIAAQDSATGVAAVGCSVVPQGQAPALAACTSPTAETVANAAKGRFTLTVRATDRAGNQAQQARSFIVR